MCGIAGAFGQHASAEIAAAMGRAIAHRGPDDCGMFVRDDVALAHRRLAIIDLSPSGHQPMSYANGRYTIVYNGEVYNFAKVRRELESLGHAFTSHSDTEVILAAYAQWGAASVTRLRGMFAFAIYDAEERELFLARDRFGIKPLYVTQRDHTLLFASELKALLASGVVARTLDRDSLAIYFALGSMPQPRTAIEGVEMLPAAHTMRVRRDGSRELARYWDLADAQPIRGLDARAAAERTRELLEEATRLHMIADVPVGAFLSGGIDSTAVVGLMTRASGQRIRTFSVGFADGDGVTDERAWARLAAERFGAEHTEVVVSGAEVAEQFDDLVRAIDQPSLDGTNTYLVSRAAARDLKVVLSGLGGDELFAGYPHFRALHRAAKFDRLRAIARHVPGRFLRDRNLIASSTADRYATLRNLSGATGALACRYAPLLRDFHDSIAQTTYIETNRYLADTLLRDADAMAMRWSLEVRPVLLDHKLAEFAFALPASLKLGAINKPVLVDAVRDVLPPELLARKKTGFELPLQSWLIGPLRERALDAFSTELARRILPESPVEQLRNHQKPSLRVWAWLVLVEWLRAYGIDA
jgi:asparagine synthase (glutamine-hydrolysing)